MDLHPHSTQVLLKGTSCSGNIAHQRLTHSYTKTLTCKMEFEQRSIIDSDI